MKNLLLSPEGVVHPPVSSQTLKLVAWKVSGDKTSSRSFELPNSWLQVGDKELRQLKTAAGDSGIAGVNQNKLIHFKPVWNMWLIYWLSYMQKAMSIGQLTATGLQYLHSMRELKATKLVNMTSFVNLRQEFQQKPTRAKIHANVGCK